MVGRRGEAPLVPPYRGCRPSMAMTLVAGDLSENGKHRLMELESAWRGGRR